LAMVLELIHLATLVHDDIMDGADLRRGQPTAAARWGNAITVLLGDALFAHALKVSTTFEDAEISREIAMAASDVCTGEIIQTQRRFDLNLSEREYFRIIELKTAALFAAASRLGARLSGGELRVVAAMDDYGRKLGVAYQIYDDCLDLAGDESEAGKTLGSDIRKGKLTLPLLRLMDGRANGHSPEISRLLLSGEEESIQVLAAMSRESGALNDAVGTAQRMVEEAVEGLVVLPESEARDALQNVAVCVHDLLGGFMERSGREPREA